METPWTEQDIQSFTSRHWNLEEVESQKAQLLKGASRVNIHSSCLLGNGIFALDAAEKHRAILAFSELLNSKNTLGRFIPASGAASRMFACLRGEVSDEILDDLSIRGHRLPMLEASSYEGVSPLLRAKALIKDLLDPASGWAGLPKGLIPFHRYSNGDVRTPFEEHAYEWQALAPGHRLYFTVPLPFRNAIGDLLNEKGFQGTELDIQSAETDTLALDIETDQWVRDEHGHLLFRPGGHGALLQNLNAIQDDFIFIRNIDNVVARHHMSARNEVQSWIGGEAFRLTEERNSLVHSIRSGSDEAIIHAMDWLQQFSKNESDRTSDELLESLDRPIRVAGMVANDGDAGGGPFWIRLNSGDIVPAIVEGAEMEESRLGQGTHFNPVDMCCSINDPNGSAYDLTKFASTDSFFTAKKNWKGRSIRILERPGLWNGAMTNWLTRFIEVPPETFAPVKSILDLMDDRRMK
jgi:hypothetical protein